MNVVKTIEVPTGHIVIVEGQKGKLELVSLGDYGKDVNIKCDALGLSREPGRVVHTKMLPLEEKWVITVSTQYGCSMGCAFCDVPAVGNGRNATLLDLTQQVLTGIALHPEVKSTKRLNIHFARMGEPSWNPAVLDATRWLERYLRPSYAIHPVVSTMMPRRNEWLKTFIDAWMRIKNEFLGGEAGLQLSINSTDEHERREMFSDNACSLGEISRIMEEMWRPLGRKITLNFALGEGWTIDPDRLLWHFSPDDYIVKLTPMHATTMARVRNMLPTGDQTTFAPYRETEEALKSAGFEVLVFLASQVEDDSKITCGNAILAGA